MNRREWIAAILAAPAAFAVALNSKPTIYIDADQEWSREAARVVEELFSMTPPPSREYVMARLEAIPDLAITADGKPIGTVKIPWREVMAGD